MSPARAPIVRPTGGIARVKGPFDSDSDDEDVKGEEDEDEEEDEEGPGPTGDPPRWS